MNIGSHYKGTFSLLFFVYRSTAIFFHHVFFQRGTVSCQQNPSIKAVQWEAETKIELHILKVYGYIFREVTLSYSFLPPFSIWVNS